MWLRMWQQSLPVKSSWLLESIESSKFTLIRHTHTDFELCPIKDCDTFLLLSTHSGQSALQYDTSINFLSVVICWWSLVPNVLVSDVTEVSGQNWQGPKQCTCHSEEVALVSSALNCCYLTLLHIVHSFVQQWTVCRPKGLEGHRTAMRTTACAHMRPLMSNRRSCKKKTQQQQQNVCEDEDTIAISALPATPMQHCWSIVHEHTHWWAILVILRRGDGDWLLESIKRRLDTDCFLRGQPFFRVFLWFRVTSRLPSDSALIHVPLLLFWAIFCRKLSISSAIQSWQCCRHICCWCRGS